MLVLFFLILLLNFVFIFCNKCCSIDLRAPPGFTLVKFNARSLKNVVARKEVASMEKCKEFAESKKGLAFNFGRENFTESSSIEDDLYNSNCIVLDCPEIHNFTALQNATGMKYYSSYPYWLWNNNNLTNGSISCVPRVGLFMFFEDRLNFTDARLSCQNLNGTLAHVISEERTEGLAKFIGNSPTYVGLSSQGEKRNWKNEIDEPLECFDYRAWDRGEPTNSRGCVVLFRKNLRAIPIWRVLPCKLSFPYICEIPPTKVTKHHRKNKKPN
ncbi:lithostathine-1 [Belonocnema kinseyi]|uniref:lithostathine-1 n=1 Tax=Belonocnema kinseyi TaxID=2817044 RepID=UPI00143DDE9B|nr:lithostathine-1 [Belonocnema kinseyi]